MVKICFNLAAHKGISFEDYQQHVIQLSALSVINREDDFSHEQIEARIEKLEKYEADFGIAFYDEKLWLHDFLHGPIQMRYGQWAHKKLKESIFKGNFEYKEEEDESEWFWSGYTQDEVLISQFNPPSLEIECQFYYLSLLIPGDSIYPNEYDLCCAYSILYDLPYYLLLGDRLFENIPAFNTLYQILLHAERDEWDLELISEYGGITSIPYKKKLAQVVDLPALG